MFDLDENVVAEQPDLGEETGVDFEMEALKHITLELDECFTLEEKYNQRLKERTQQGDVVSKKAWEIVKENTDTHIKEDAYIGVYEDSWFGKMEVFKKGTQLWIKSQKSPKLNGAMHFYQANTFAVKWEFQDMNADAFAMFTLDETGKAIGIKMKGISPNIDFSFDFHDLDLKRIK